LLAAVVVPVFAANSFSFVRTLAVMMPGGDNNVDDLASMKNDNCNTHDGNPVMNLVLRSRQRCIDDDDADLRVCLLINPSGRKETLLEPLLELRRCGHHMAARVGTS
jgi:hypothetical protein